MTGFVEPPPEFQPLSGQIPPFITDDEQLRRWEWCFAVTRAYLGFDSPNWTRELFFSDIPVDPAPEGQSLPTS
jgi:hypothetical protein